MNEGGSSRRYSSIVLLVIIVVLALSLTALFQAYIVSVDANPDNDATMGYYLLIGFVGLALSTYMLFQTRRHIQRFTLETPPTVTTLVCQKCGFKNVRNFERGDYILKDMGKCSKCEGTMMISAIYREVKEKRKEERVFT